MQQTPKPCARPGLSSVIGLFLVAASTASLACDRVVTQDTTLTEDITGCTGDGIVIAADGVTLDLNGHRVAGFRKEKSAGIRVQGVNNITIVNGTVESFERGIYIADASSVMVTGVKSRANRFDGIVVSNSSAVELVANELAANSRTGVDTINSDVRLTSNLASSNTEYGFAATGGSVTFINNSSEGGANRAAFLASGGSGMTPTGSAFQANRAARFKGYGFQFGAGAIVDDLGGNQASGKRAKACYPDPCPLSLK